MDSTQRRMIKASARRWWHGHGKPAGWDEPGARRARFIGSVVAGLVFWFVRSRIR